MTDRSGFPDIERVLVVLFADLVDEDPDADPTTFTHIGTDTPSGLQATLPYIRVERIGGEDDDITDVPLVAVDAFAATRSAARQLAENIRQRLQTRPIPVTFGVTLDYATTATGPNRIPWSDDQTIQRFTANYRISARRV